MAIDRKTYTKAEWDALEKKLENPKIKVLCPRCGNEIIYDPREF